MADRLDEHLLPAGLAPAAWSVFDPDWYAREAGLAERDAAALRAHYLAEGQAAGLSPVRYFDEAWYRAENPDIAAAIAAGTWRSGFEHYCLEGHADRAPHFLFDDALYAAGCPDPAGHFNRYDHFLKLGAAAGLPGHPLVDVPWYAARAGVPAQHAFGHLLDALRFGPVEPAPSARFDPAWYLAAQPAAARAVAEGRYRGALHHYLCTEAPTAFDPLPDFSEAAYLARTPEAAALVAAGVMRNGYAHFLVRGATAVAERRRPGAGAALPLLTRGRLDMTPSAPPALAALVRVPDERARALPALAALRAAVPQAVELFLLDGNGQAGGLAALTGGARMLAGGLGAACASVLSQSTAPALLLLDGAAEPSAAAIQAGLRRLAADPSAAVVGGPVVGADGALLDAGRIVLPNGAMRSYLHGAPAQVSEAGFVREPDAVAETQALFRRDAVAALGGFAAELADAEVVPDLCLRAWQGGYRVVLDPALAAVLPGRRARRAAFLPAGASAALAARHGPYLRRPRRAGAADQVRRSAPERECVLLIVPALPAPGEPAAARAAALAAEGAEVTLYPLDGGPADPALLPAYLPETVEIICGPGEAGLAAFRAARGEGFFSRVEGEGSGGG